MDRQRQGLRFGDLDIERGAARCTGAPTALRPSSTAASIAVLTCASNTALASGWWAA
jgi:hypothetical protein